MAITASREAEGVVGDARVRLRPRRARAWPLHAFVVALVATATLFSSQSCRADRWSIDAGIGSELTRTSNADLGGTGSSPDTLLAARTHVRLLGEGARLRIAGSAALNVVGYAEHTQAGRLNPAVDLEANLQAIERL